MHAKQVASFPDFTQFVLKAKQKRSFGSFPVTSTSSKATRGFLAPRGEEHSSNLAAK